MVGGNKINLIKLGKKVSWVCSKDINGDNKPLLFFFRKPCVLRNNAFVPAGILNQSAHVIDFVAADSFQVIAQTLGVENACSVGLTSEGKSVLRSSSECSQWAYSFADKRSVKNATDVWGSSHVKEMSECVDITSVLVVLSDEKSSKLCLQTVHINTIK